MAYSGRDLVVKKAGTAIAGVRENGITVDKSPVDITNQGSGGYRQLADFGGVESLDISVSGIITDDVLLDAALSSSSALLTDITIEFPNGDTLSGDFYLANFATTGAHGGEQTFTASLQSSEAWTHTPSS